MFTLILGVILGTLAGLWLIAAGLFLQVGFDTAPRIGERVVGWVISLSGIALIYFTWSNAGISISVGA